MEEKKYLILPGCDDTNRGDQALIWETARIAKESGFEGHYSMIATKECGNQSKTVGIDSLAYLLPHPSMHIKGGSDNRAYDFALKVKWALYALRDLLLAYPLSKKISRPIVSLFLSKDQKQTIMTYKSAEAAFVKGGGFLHDYGGFVDSYKIYFFLYHINLALSMGIPVYVMPNSFGPFSSNSSKRMVRKCLSKCRVVFSRESVSQNSLKINCDVDSILSRDLAMYLEKDSEFDAGKLLLEEGIVSSSRKTVGITVRPYRFPGEANPEGLYEKYKEAICDLISWLSINGFNPVLIEHVFSDNYHERDIICINEIIDMLAIKGLHVAVFSDLSLNCRQMKSIYSEMDYLIGTRFHSVIFSLTERVPSIAITYGGNKGIGIMHDLGLDEYALPIESISGISLIKAFQHLREDEISVRKKIDALCKNVKRDQKQITELIREISTKSV